VFTCEVTVLGQQRLSVLRERIACANDVGMRHDVSACPERLGDADARVKLRTLHLHLICFTHFLPSMGSLDNN
jgi:hypothetical protein